MTGNSVELLRYLRGKWIVGVIHGYRGRGSEGSAELLVLDNGEGFAFNSNGAFWLESPGDVAEAIDTLRENWQHAVEHHREMVELATEVGKGAERVR